MKPDIKAIKERCYKATPGPWKVIGDGVIQGLKGYNEDFGSVNEVDVWENNDAEFIANSRQDIPALLDYIADLEAVSEAAKYRQSIKYKKLSDNHEIDVLMREEAENVLMDALAKLDGEKE